MSAQDVTQDVHGAEFLFEKIRQEHVARSSEKMTFLEYLERCKDDPSCFATAPERMLKAIGEPKVVDTQSSQDPRLSRIFRNRTVRFYPSFSDFYGMEEVIERIVGFFTAAAQGLEEKKQILYLLGPVGGGKSSLAEHLKFLMEKEPIFVLAVKDKESGEFIPSPVFESPLGVIPLEHKEGFEKAFRIPQLYMSSIMSPWAAKRLKEFDGDIKKFHVLKMFPSKAYQVCVVKTEPSDENNQDVSTLVGKVDIRKLEFLRSSDPDAYGYDGALNRATQGILEFVEMFKAPIKVLNPLLTATQEGNYVGTEGMGAMPFQGIILAHSNEAEWQNFKGNRNNEAFLDRITVIKVPYCLRVNEEVQIYQKLISAGKLKGAPCAPDTLRVLAQLCVLSRLKVHENSPIFTKMRVYNGENLKDTDPNAKPFHEYLEQAGVDEGMKGVSTRFAFKVLSSTFNFDPDEVSADPVHLLFVLENAIKREQFSKEEEERLMGFIKEFIKPRYAEFIGHEIQKAYIESYAEYGQNIFDQYIAMADAWISDEGYKHPDTGVMYDRSALEKELSQIEKPSGISNPKDFRNEVVKFALRARARHPEGKNPNWTSYEKLREVIEKKMFASTADLLPVISFGAKKDTETDKKHKNFVQRMCERGYTERQVRRLVEWYMRVHKAG